MLLLPYIQADFNLLEIPPLKGAIVPVTDSSFTLKGWFSGDFQEMREKYLNESFGFRNIFVRLNNQLKFSLFKKANAKDVIVGKDNYIYERSYISSYYGQDFIGIDSITQRMQRLKLISDTLSRMNKCLISVFVLGKGTFFPDFIPDKYITEKGKTNIDYHIKFAKELNLNFIDFKNYFLSLKNKSEYPLYPKYGIHWSYFSVCLAADSIIRYIEKLRHIDMPNLRWNEIKIDIAKKGDIDVSEGMNLLFRLEPEYMAYPSIQFESDVGKTKPTVLVISDSFYWSMYGFGISKSFSNDHFWYYNHEVYPDFYKKPKYVEDLDLLGEILKHDVIIIMAGEATIQDFSFGFIDNVYDIFKGINIKQSHSQSFNEKVASLRETMKNDPKWLESIKQKALRRNISVDSMITIDAIWILQHK